MPQLLLETSSKKDGNLSFIWGDHDEVLANRTAFLKKFDVTPDGCIVMEVEHGDKISHVDSSNIGETIKTEALITKDTGVILFLLTADCFPVAFHDPEKQVVALAHLGWKPTDKGLAAKIVKEMEEVYGSHPKDIQVFIGPGIHKESYAFESPLQKQLPGWSEFLTDLPNGETQIDLIGHIQKQLLDSGVLQENIQTSAVDTATDDYFSHYRSVRTGEPEGRFTTIIGIR